MVARPALARKLKTPNLLRRPLAQSETFIGKICGDDESDPANPDGHHNVPDRHVPPAGEADGVKQSYQREKHCGDEGKDLLCHFAPRWTGTLQPAVLIKFRCVHTGTRLRQRLGTALSLPTAATSRLWLSPPRARYAKRNLVGQRGTRNVLEHSLL